ncbi:conserved hypothetical protein [Verticillium alfalfae VaMs.102]|uniref:Transcriptional regulatory protein DEP1 n=2 Tax=Verticillium TaxID=1036719 RepID=C9SMM4_VERA1|nr:conserved hypothetical protein [Verticillium alfalfae VaMs.102]EEY20039.1 conserved hypothetical protein [Verticillium alfalfae VaMs.102]
MAAAGAIPPALSPEQPTLDHDDSNISSPLSDVEDGDGDEGSLDVMNIHHDTPRQHDDDEGDVSESDSNLSDANDTEAETERLFDTPQAQRHRDVVVNEFNDGQIFEHTPSKLQKTFSVDDEADNSDNESLSDNDDVSLASSPGDGSPSPTKPAKPAVTSLASPVRESSETKKRKRSLPVDQSDSDQPLRKRTGSFAAPDLGDAARREDDEDDPLSTRPNSGNQSADEEIPVLTTEAKTEPSRDSASPVKAHPPTRALSPVWTRMWLLPEVEDDADAAARDEEERRATTCNGMNERQLTPRAVERKQAALDEWSQLEARFVLFRERLYKERLERLEAEEQSLQSDNPTHPEYLLMRQCLDERLDNRMREVNREHELTIQALDRLSVARRAQIWGQFYQGIREKREQYLESLNQEWYETQNARRSAHSVPDYSIQFPTIPAQRTRNAVAYNTEVAYLAGLAKHEGFPAVPAMRGASAAEIDDDLEAIKRSIMQPLEDYQAVSFGGTLGPAGEQFIKNTPWANPNHISHKMQHVPLHSEPGSSTAMSSAPPQAGPSHVGQHHHHHHHHHQQQQHLPPPPPNGQATSQQSPTLSAVSPETLRTASVLSQGVHMKHAGMGGVGRGTKAVQAQEPASKQDMPMAVAT